MKIFLFVLIGVIASNLAVNAQDAAATNVPPAVAQAFKTKFPGATDVKWDTRKDGYKVEFKIGTRGHDGWYDKAGALKKHKEDFPKSELPQPIRQKLETDFKSYKIDDVDKIEENGEVVYVVKLKGAGEERKISFLPNGNLKEKSDD